MPFHYWTPDAYQGSPTPVTGYLSVGPKVGAFALILRLFVEALGPLADWWLPVMIVLAALTMTLGNLVALTQDNVKRMLAYSSIAHTGYMLVGLAAWAGDPSGRIDGLEALLFYGAAYAFMNLGRVRGRRRAAEAGRASRPSLATFAGLGRREPLLGDPDDALPAVADRHPADGRLLRQGERHPRRGPGRRAADDPGGHRGPQRRGRRVLLPARRRLHVHARAGDRDAGAAPRRAAVGRPGGRHRR